MLNTPKGKTMGFNPTEAEQLLADCGRRCCVCGRLHRVQVHHIVPGDDNINNGIPLCPNCHDEAHTQCSPGRTTRTYTPNELKLHRKRTIEQVKREGKWKPGSTEWKKDKELIAFYAQCLDRSAFRTHFHQELSFADFDQAMEDTLLALNTGYWRTREGTLIERAKGKACVVNPQWREKLEKITNLIEDVRRRFHQLLGLNDMLSHRRGLGPFHHHMFDDFMEGFRHDRDLGNSMDQQRQEAIDIMNSLLQEVGMQPLSGLREH
jgi:hypothetical protein